MKKWCFRIFLGGALALLTPASGYGQDGVPEQVFDEVDVLYQEAFAVLYEAPWGEGSPSLVERIQRQVERIETGGAACGLAPAVFCIEPARLIHNLAALQRLLALDQRMLNRNARLFPWADSLARADTLLLKKRAPSTRPIAEETVEYLRARIVPSLHALHQFAREMLLYVPDILRVIRLSDYQRLYLDFRNLRTEAGLRTRLSATTAALQGLSERIDRLAGRPPLRRLSNGGFSLAGYTTNVVGVGGYSSFGTSCPLAGTSCLVSVHFLYESTGADVGFEAGLGQRIGDWGLMAGVLFIDRDTDRWAAVGTLLYFRLPAWGIGASFSTVQGLGVKVLYKL